MVYDPVIQGRRHLFGVSGLLYRRNLLMYDHETKSLWSQLATQAVTGPLAGASLPILPAEHTTWEDWKARHPQTSVLSFNTGYFRDYNQDPYRDLPLSRKEAAAVFYGGVVKLYPLDELKKAGGQLVDQLAGKYLRLQYDPERHRLSVRDETGAIVNYFIAFLAELRPFYPRAAIFQFKQKE